jgi:hypothetical protein
MGTPLALASRLTVLTLLTLILTQQAKAVIYTPTTFLVTGSFSFDVINPSDLNNMSGGTAPIPGFIGGRLQLERGLFTPSWTHWMEFDYFTASSSASGDTGAFDLSLKYMAILPLGVTYWFARTAFIDFGLALGGGIGLAPSYTFTSTTSAGVATTSNFTGKLGPVFAGRLDARFWLNEYFAATFAAGLHVFSSQLTPTSGASINGAFSGISMIGGLTYAIGGIKGRGRSYVEVIHDKPDVKPTPAPKKPVAPPAARGKRPVPPSKPMPKPAPTPVPTP